MKKKKKYTKKELYELGGILNTLQPLLPALNLAVPGLGTGLSAAAGIGSGLLEDNTPAVPLKQTTNIYMKGGLLKKYNAPSHAKGGQLINSIGNPDPNGNAEIELQEAAVTDSKGDSYIFSDRLGTADKIKKIYSRMKGDDSISRKGRELSTKNLIKENEAMKAQMEQEMKYGGKYPNGGDIYSGGTLPEFTVVANKKNSKNSDEIKLLEYMQGVGLKKSVYDLWKEVGSPSIKEKDNVLAGSYDASKNEIEVPISGKYSRHGIQSILNQRAKKAGTSKIADPTLNVFLAETTHALQNKVSKDPNRRSKKAREEFKKYGERTYSMKGSEEHDAHEVIEPWVRQKYETMPNNSKVQYFKKYGGKYPLGGDLSKALMSILPQLSDYNLGNTAVSNPSYPDPSFDPVENRSVEDKRFLSGLSSMGALPNINLPLGKVSSTTAPGFTSLPTKTRATNTFDNQPYTEGDLNTTTKSELPLDKLGLGLKGLSFIGSAIDAFQKPAKEQPRLTDYNRGNRLVAGTGVSDDALQREIDLQTSKGLDINRQVSGNVGNYLSRAQNILSRAGSAKAQTAMQTKQYNDQLNLQKAARADGMAREDAAKLRETDVANLQNRAMKQDAVANLMTNINNLGTELTRQAAIKSQVANMNDMQKKDFLLKAAALNIQNPNFQIGSLSEIQKALDAGDYDAAIKAIVTFKQ
jgi:hypothetical protein